MISFQVVRALRLPFATDAPRLQGASPPAVPPRSLAYGDICFRAKATIVDAATNEPHMVVTGYLASPAVSDIVKDACERAANTAQRCTEPELCVLRRNDAHKCEGIIYEVIT